MAGPFVFIDLRTRDAAAARAFYGELAGFTATDAAGPPLFTEDGAPWGGLTELGPDDERAPQWVPYIGVPDLEAATTEAERLGGTVVRPRTDLPAGSATVLRDPGGATFVLWEAAA